MTMTQAGRRPRLLVAATLICLAGHARAAAAQDSLGPRVRSTDAVVTALLGWAAEGSATLRGELHTISSTNGLIYIEKGQCGHGVRACLANSVTTAGGYRLLRVKVDLQRSEREIMASIGHELQHAIEVLSDLSVTDDTLLFRFYQRESPSAKADAFETQAATNTGLAVYHELANHK
jgi:hypothetical protein